MSDADKTQVSKSLLVLATAVALVVAVLLALITAPLLSGDRADRALASTRCSGGSGGQATPTPTPTESESPDPDPIPPLPLPTDSETPTPTPTATTTDGPEGEATRCDSEITISHDRARQVFSGVVKSGETACERGRRVKLKLERDGKDRTVEVTTTTRRGAWRAAFPNPRGRRFYAVATKTSVMGPTGEIICRSDRSRTIRAQNPG